LSSSSSILEDRYDISGERNGERRQIV